MITPLSRHPSPRRTFTMDTCTMDTNTMSIRATGTTMQRMHMLHAATMRLKNIAWRQNPASH